MRTLTAGLAVIALFTAAAVGGVWLLTREPGGAAIGEPAGDAAPEPGPAPSPHPQAALPPQAAPTAFVLPPPPEDVILGPPPIEPPEDSWEAVPIAPRASALGTVGGAIGRGLIALQPKLTACSDEDAQARHGTARRTFVKDQFTPDRHGGTVLVLQIETARGQARIVDAPMQAQGRASDGLVACAQQVLRGSTFSVPQAQAGQRYRLMHPLR